jgi:gluconolactonase
MRQAAFHVSKMGALAHHLRTKKAYRHFRFRRYDIDNPGGFMPRPIARFLFVLIVPLLGGGTAMATSIFAPGATLQTLSTDYKFTEGPACDADGNVYFTDQPNDRIVEWTSEGKFTIFMQPCGRSNGLCFDGKGNLISCADEKNELWSIDMKTKAVTVLVKEYHGKLLNGPNDVWIRPDGGIYFTDPYYQRDYWKRGPQEQDGHHVYFLTPDRKTVTRVTSDLTMPNGIIGTPDGKTLYVSDLNAQKTYVYKINDDGSLADKKLFCEAGSDGMTIDSEGDIYITNSHGVTVFDLAGKQIENIRIEQPWTGNICFGGKDRHTLFITASTGIYTMQMRVNGVGSQ